MIINFCNIIIDTTKIQSVHWSSRSITVDLINGRVITRLYPKDSKFDFDAFRKQMLSCNNICDLGSFCFINCNVVDSIYVKEYPGGDAIQVLFENDPKALNIETHYDRNKNSEQGIEHILKRMEKSRGET